MNVGANVTQLAVGGAHTCALLDGANVRCWGFNRSNLGTYKSPSGQLGYGHTRDIGYYETPVSVGDVNVGGTVIQIAAGDIHSCALLEGRLRSWGWNGSGQLGYGNTDTIGDDETPLSAGDVQIAASGSGVKVIQIAAGGAHSCALLDTGNVRCWGDNEHGQLGYGNTDTIGDDETPLSAGDVQTAASGSGVKVIQIAAGGAHSCALLDTGNVRCWGDNEHGQLGYGAY